MALTPAARRALEEAAAVDALTMRVTAARTSCRKWLKYKDEYYHKNTHTNLAV